MNYKMRRLAVFIVLLVGIIFSATLWARAGGGGGGHSGGGGGHSGGYSSGGGYSGSGGVYIAGNSGDSGISFFVFIVIIIFVIFVFKKSKRNRTDIEPASISNFTAIQLDPDTKNKITKAFLVIQKSWSEKRLDLMRRFISDGVYQRFNAQFTMMNLLDQTDIMENVSIESIKQVALRSDGPYDVIDIAITAFAEDQFISQKFPVLNSPGGGESFTEFWTFIRRKNYKKGLDIYTTDSCPKCSAPLGAKLLESAQCPFCFTYINNGEYDWVLAEITQAEDYSRDAGYELTSEVQSRAPSLSKQQIEDRASNAFMQILIASAEKQSAPLARFTSAKLLPALNELMNQTNFLYDRLFLNSADVLSCSLENNWCTIEVAIRYSFRRAKIENQYAYLLDEEIQNDTRKLTLIKNLEGATSKGSVYANTCSHCGAAQKDSLTSVCAFCTQALNDPKTEWIVDQMQ